MGTSDEGNSEATLLQLTGLKKSGGKKRGQKVGPSPKLCNGAAETNIFWARVTVLTRGRSNLKHIKMKGKTTISVPCGAGMNGFP